MSDADPPEGGLQSSRYAVLRAEIVRAGESLTEAQLLDLADSLHGLIRLRRPHRSIRRPEAWIADEPQNFS